MVILSLSNTDDLERPGPQYFKPEEELLKESLNLGFKWSPETNVGPQVWIVLQLTFHTHCTFQTKPGRCEINNSCKYLIKKSILSVCVSPIIYAGPELSSNPGSLSSHKS